MHPEFRDGKIERKLKGSLLKTGNRTKTSNNNQAPLAGLLDVKRGGAQEGRRNLSAVILWLEIIAQPSCAHPRTVLSGQCDLIVTNRY